MYQNINKELAKIFRNMSHIYEFLDGKFRALAYAKEGCSKIFVNLPFRVILRTKSEGSHLLIF
jgi:DNA polymerase (family 10)